MGQEIGPLPLALSPLQGEGEPESGAAAILIACVSDATLAGQPDGLDACLQQRGGG